MARRGAAAARSPKPRGLPRAHAAQPVAPCRRRPALALRLAGAALSWRRPASGPVPARQRRRRAGAAPRRRRPGGAALPAGLRSRRPVAARRARRRTCAALPTTFCSPASTMSAAQALGEGKHGRWVKSAGRQVAAAWLVGEVSMAAGDGGTAGG